MAYLRLKDYNQQIQADNLTAILTGQDSVRTISELSAQAEMISYLTQKYQADQEFTDTLAFSVATKYYAKSRIELDATAWSNATAYVIGDTVSLGGYVYISIQNGTNKDPVTQTTYWKKIGVQYSLWYIPTPYPEFDYTSVYRVGDLVWWKNKVYKCLQATAIPDHEVTLQFGDYASVPLSNVFPDDIVEGIAAWGVGVAYSVTGLTVGLLPSDFTAWSSITAYVVGDKISYLGIIYSAVANNTNVLPTSDFKKWEPVSWLAGDNRSAQMVQYMIDVCLYHIHSRIAPRNIPQLRVDRRDEAVKWLKMAGDGSITASLPIKQPKQGGRIRYGGNVKNANSY